MGELKDLDDFHKQQNICIECNGLGFKRVKAPYNRYGRWYNDCYDKFKCKKCGGTGKYTN